MDATAILATFCGGQKSREDCDQRGFATEMMPDTEGNEAQQSRNCKYVRN